MKIKLASVLIFAIYARISSDPENDAAGVRRQIGFIQDAIEKEFGYRVPEESIFIDNDISASRHSRKIRPEYRRMVQGIRGGVFNAVYSWHTSRLTRSPKELEALIDLFDETGVIYRFVKSPPFDLNTAQGRMLLRMLNTFDAASSDTTSEFVRAQRRAQRDAGILNLGRSRNFGYQDRACTQGHQEEMVFVKWLFRHISEGGLPGEARDHFIAQGAVGTQGSRTWSHNQIHYLIRNPIYMGMMRNSDGDLIKAVGVVPLVTEERWHAAQEKMNRRKPGKATPVRKAYLLSGAITCGACGATMRAQKEWRDNKGRVRQAFWRCPAAPMGCGGNSRTMQLVDAVIHSAVDVKLRRVHDLVEAAEAAAGLTVEEEALEEVATQLQRIRDGIASGDLDAEAALDVMVSLRRREAALRTQVNAARSQRTKRRQSLRAGALETWRSGDVPAQRLILSGLVESIVILPAHHQKTDLHRTIQIKFAA